MGEEGICVDGQAGSRGLSEFDINPVDISVRGFGDSDTDVAEVVGLAGDLVENGLFGC